MHIDIVPEVKKKYRFNFEFCIRQLLRNIPEDHLRGLERIVIVDSWETKGGMSRGLYYERFQENGPAIVICAKPLLGNLPKFVEYLPLIPKMIVADALFHEIAHHYQRIRHGIKKEAREIDAKRYSDMMWKKTFRLSRWIMYGLYGPIVIPWKFLRKLAPGTRGTRCDSTHDA